MEILELDSSNVTDYEDLLDKDVAESIGREYYRGIVALDDGGSPSGAMVWEYKNLDEDDDTKAEICFLHSEETETAQSLLEEFDDQASSNDVCRSFFELSDLPDEIKQVLRENGFDISSGEGKNLTISVSDLNALASMKKKLPDGVVALEEVMEVKFIQGVTNIMFHGKKGIMEDLEFVEKSWYDESISSCVITDGKISGMFLVHRFPSGMLMPVLFAAMGPNLKMDLMNMILFTAKKTVETYPGDTPVCIKRHSDEVAGLTRKLIGDKQGRLAVLGSKE